MKNNPKAWALYWRNILADTSWSITIDSKEMKYTDVNLDHLRALHLPDRAVVQLFKESTSKDKEDKKENVIEVAISPVIFSKNREHMEKSDSLPDKIAPIWLRFDLYLDGSLKFNMKRYKDGQRDIWITRNYLNPTQNTEQGKEGVTFGSVEDMDHFIANNVFTGTEWKNLFDSETLAKKGLRVVFSSFFDAGLSATIGAAAEIATTAVNVIKDSISERSITSVAEHYSDEVGELLTDKLEDAVLPKIGLNKNDQIDFDSVLGYAISMLKAVSPDYLNQMELMGYSIIENQHGVVAVYPDNSKITGHIKRAYSAIIDLDQKKIPALFSNYASASKPKPRIPFSALTCFKNGALHNGHMSDKHGLSASQREAVSHVESYKDKGSIMAVNGPPGTGKTTLLQDVVATEWVNSALKASNALEAVPCIIVASSANNQAVTNIIESFQSIDGITRWLPDPDNDAETMSGIGLYLTNSKKVVQTDYHYTKSFKMPENAGDGLPAKIESPEYIAKATAVFLGQYGCQFGIKEGDTSLEKAAIHLHCVLKENHKAMTRIISLAVEMYETFSDLDGNKINRDLNSAREDFSQLKIQSKRLESHHDKWLEHIEMEPFLISLLSFFPVFKKKQIARNKRLLNSLQGLPFSYSNGSENEVNDFFKHTIQQTANNYKKCSNEVKKHEKEKLRFENTKKELVQLCGTYIDLGEPDEIIKLISALDEFQNGDSLSARIDKVLRYRMFIITLHFWEARWLLAANELYEGNKRKKESGNQAGKENLWRRYAMLTPCFVTTMHSGPSFFSFYNRENIPLFEFVDLLIVDEAGQVSPELAGPMFSLAKRAVVVGDRQQIEPVWSVAKHMDYASLVHYKLYANEEIAESNDETGMHCSNGSVMRIAQNSSPIQKQDKGDYKFERGMFLAEHRRCVDPLVRYFNDLAYGGQIIPMRGDQKKEDPRLTPWQHVDIDGNDEKIGSSRRNNDEAEAIAIWIKENKAFLEDHYNQPIHEIIGIITPFALQYKAIEVALKSHKITSSGVAIKGGTVHALQGAERAVILFSTVYSSPDGSYFFNQGVNMLNVAVSRAKDIFVVVGSRSIFKPTGREPLDLMDKYF